MARVRYFTFNSRTNYHGKPRQFKEIDEEEYWELGGTRKCRTCGQELPRTEFYNLARSPDGLHPDCKQCCKVSRALEAVRKRDKRSKLSVRQRVRAMNLGIRYEYVLLVEVFRMYRGICYICAEWVPPGKASMDHKVALTNGGEHTYDNVGLTHLKCNLRKGSRHHAE